ncbi:MAG TPA: type II toxin-antitoxin system VapC family toxin [Rhizomicrobium sp.]|jgi:predicted nucleic-acid-binding protein|nr:type II toxin-antitoxin system VapC family toxin [Rhizomicrobium sp.]
MLAIDTNLVIRYLVGDHPTQAAKARSLIDGNDVFVGATVLLESEWVLGSIYGFDSERITAALAAFAGLPRVTVEDPALLATALDWMSKGIDFADALHLLRPEHCEAFVTFDARFAKAANRLGGLSVRTP